MPVANNTAVLAAFCTAMVYLAAENCARPQQRPQAAALHCKLSGQSLCLLPALQLLSLGLVRLCEAMKCPFGVRIFSYAVTAVSQRRCSVLLLLARRFQGIFSLYKY